MLNELSKNLTPRMMFLLLLAGAVLILSTGYSAWFKKPIKEYSLLENRFTEMQKNPSDLAGAERETLNLRKEIADLNQQLTAIGREVLKGARPASVIADLGVYAKQHNVQVAGIKPAAEKQGKLYTEVPFNVELSGAYGQLFKWVYSLEHSNKPLFIKEFSVMAGSDEGNRRMQLTLSLIQPPEKEG